MNLKTCFFYVFVINQLQGDVPNFLLGTSPPNIFNPINDTYTFVQSDYFVKTVCVVHMNSFNIFLKVLLSNNLVYAIKI